MTAPAIQLGARQALTTGPFTGVRDVTDPFDDNPSLLVDAVNGYIVDTAASSGFYSRPGCVLGNLNSPLPGISQGAYSHTDLTGTTYNFVVNNGRLFRVDSSLETYTDVTPVTAQWTLNFTGGTGTQPVLGNTVTGASSGATGTVAQVLITSGIFGASNAIGSFVFSAITGTFTTGETLKVSGSSVGTANGTTSNSAVALSATSHRVFFVTFDGTLIISDGVNRPWIASQLTRTPVLGTAIDYDGNGTAWSAFHMTVYSGSLFFILNQVGGVFRRSDISWSNPGDPTTGYQQSNFDFNWTLEQTSSLPLYAIAGTNTGLFYWRDKSIGVLSGTPGPSFAGSVSNDAVAVDVGTLSPATVQVFGTSVFFCDQIGRPWMLPIVWYQASESRLIALWLSMRAVFNASTFAYPTATAAVACAAIEPLHTLYIAAIWSPVPGSATAPNQLVVFDAKTGAYQGRWIIGNGAGIEAMGVLNNANGQANLVFLGTAPPSTDSVLLETDAGLLLTTNSGLSIDTVDTTTTRTGMVWVMNGVVAAGLPIAMQNGNLILMEDGMTEIATEDTAVTWEDNGEVPAISVTTGRLGYSMDKVWSWDLAQVILGSQTTCDVNVITPTMNTTLEGISSAFTSNDQTYKLVVGLQAQGRGIQIIVSPITATQQFVLHQIQAIGTPSRAGWQDS